MKNVVYFLGAGFSAPLGIPVMNDFYLKGRDIYFKDKERYAHFENVIEKISILSGVKNFFDCDLYNIEEILSLIEMQRQIGDPDSLKREDFIKFISDVVAHFTPPICKERKKFNKGALPGKYNIWGDNELDRCYASFVSGLFPVTFNLIRGGSNHPFFFISKNPKASYSIITLNYDMVIENYIKFLNDNYKESDELKYIRSSNDPIPKKDANSIFLVKLHGSIDDKNVIPPTYNKDLQDEKILPAWKTADHLLREAVNIRIIGYSLPETDNNIRYLLKNSILKSRNLQAIDVICLDKSREVKNRYDKFIKFKYYRFINEKVENYFEKIYEKNELKQVESTLYSMNSDIIEEAHSEFVEKI